MRTGPNSSKRINTGRTARTGLRNGAVSAKARKPVIERHTPQWWEMEVKKRGTVRCSTCGAFFFGGHWMFVPAVQERLFARVARGATCPACATEHAHEGISAEGELLIKGLDAADRSQVLQTITGFAARERRRNPEARILSLDVRGAVMRVLTTQNHLAVRIGKKLDESRKGGTLKITYSKDDYPARAVWTAPRR